MERGLVGWEAACAQSKIVRFADVNLRGAGQVLFQNNPLTGALFLTALGWGAFVGRTPHVAIGGLSALVAATATALCLGADKTPLRQGLYGYNSLLTGLALSYFLGPGVNVWVYTVLGGVVSAIAMLGPVSAIKPWSVPAHTYPFILTTWIFLLATHGFSIPLDVALPRTEILPPAMSDPMRASDFVPGVLHSISQVYFKDNAASAALLVAGLAVNSYAAAGFAVAGAILAVATAHVFGIESELITSGLQGFSPVLTATALGSAFYRPSVRVAVFAALGTIAAVIAQSALHAVLSPMALPPLSAPFDLVAWIFFIPCKYLDSRNESVG